MMSSEKVKTKKVTQASTAEKDMWDKMNCPPKLAHCCRTNFLVFSTCTGVFIGVLVGILLHLSNAENVDDQDGYTPRDIMHVKYIGELFLRMLKGIVLPLITSSLIAGVSNLDATMSGKVGGRALAWYLSTTLLAVILGLLLVTTVIKKFRIRICIPVMLSFFSFQIQPGVGVKGMGNQAERLVLIEDTILDLFRNMFPSNLIRASTNQYHTSLVKPPNGLTQMPSYVINSSDKDTWNLEQTEEGRGTNMLGLIAFSILIGVAIGAVGQPAQPVKMFFQEFANVMMKITQWVIYLAPMGVCFLVAGAIMEMQNPSEAFEKLGYYFAAVVLGLFSHVFATLPSLFYILTRKNPYTFWLNMTQAMATAFGTASSLATLPTTIKCVEEKNGVDSRVAQLVLPIGATINMDGTALYLAVAVIFIAQVREINLGIGGLISIAIISTTGSIAAAGIPNSGLVMLILLLETFGLSSEDIGIILPVEWLLDRFKTIVNIMGDAVGSAVVYHLSKAELQELDRLKANNNRNSSNYTKNVSAAELASEVT